MGLALRIFVECKLMGGRRAEKKRPTHHINYCVIFISRTQESFPTKQQQIMADVHNEDELVDYDEENEQEDTGKVRESLWSVVGI